METKKETPEFETHAIGSIEDLSKCTKLVLYRSDSFSKITITSMKKILDLLMISKSFTILERTTQNNFIYSKLDKDNNIKYTGFNIIIYLNHLNTPIGYTEFFTVQGLIPNKVEIKLEFSTEWEGDNSSDLSNDKIIYSLCNNIKEYISLKDRLLTDDIYGYTTKIKILEDLSKNKNTQSMYTNSISDIIKDKNKIILTNHGILSYDGFRKLQLITEMTLAEDYEHYQLGYYNGEIIIYCWKKDKKDNNNNILLSAISMSRKDNFGNNIIYSTVNNESYKTLSGVEEIYYIAGNYASIKKYGANNRSLVNLQLNKNIEGSIDVNVDENSNHIIDLWGTRSQVIELPKPLNKRNLIECLPEILSLNIDIKNYKQTINLEKKIGDWFVFKERRSNLTNLGNSNTLNFLIYTNQTKTITISEEYDEIPIVVNNNCLMLRTKTTFEGKSYDYYTYFLGDGNFYSENALLAMDLVMGGNFISEKTLLNEKTKCIQYSDTNSNYYESGELMVDHVGTNILDSHCLNLRRCTCPDNYKVPEFIGAINGLLYYKIGNKIKLL